MGSVLTYCTRCGIQLVPNRFRDGGAIQYRDKSYCSKCLPASARAALEKERATAPSAVVVSGSGPAGPGAGPGGAHGVGSAARGAWRRPSSGRRPAAAVSGKGGDSSAATLTRPSSGPARSHAMLPAGPLAWAVGSFLVTLIAGSVILWVGRGAPPPAAADAAAAVNRASAGAAGSPDGSSRPEPAPAATVHDQVPPVPEPRSSPAGSSEAQPVPGPAVPARLVSPAGTAAPDPKAAIEQPHDPHPAPPATDTAIAINTVTGKAHRLSCPYLPAEGKRRACASVEEARAAGAVPCRVCKPW
ncbi:MAG: hypothetical protein HYZ53_00350 [Planctomycetes bacterium]|nr:hypothetical protein [Planctomycetota bacterium]